ncbi:ribose-phosphate diphosphokinase [Colletotrichum tofieldiae]|nr:ribose-phosphate diphosphokinase [Colletotrichum tofieldiae]
MVRNIIVLGGNTHPELVNSVCNNLGLNPCERVLTKFSVGESRCEIKDSVRGKDVFIIQTASGSVNDGFMDLCIMVSACKTGSAKRVTAVMPLFPYSRQPDVPYKKTGAPLSKMDLHDPQYQGFFDVPVDNLYGKPLIKRYIQQNIPNYKDAVVISPDAGGAKRATAIADELDMAFALIHKERRPTKYTEQRNASMMLVGDVKDKVCILVDDLIDTGNTITRAAKLLKKEGATHIYALLTHGILSGDAIPRINASAIDKMVVTNTVPQRDHMRVCPKLEYLDVSPVFAEAIRRVHHGESISVLFQHN